jgi:GntR family transcriptional repressor for pyruvate dehydrogenase complex
LAWSAQENPLSGSDLLHTLETFIFSEAVAPGDKLPSERWLANHFNVSRHTLREVMRTLEGRGLLRIEAGRGAFVQDQTLADANRVTAAARQGAVTPAQLIEARLMIECAAAGLAALRRDEEDLRILEKLIEAMDPHADTETNLFADIEFHTQIAKAARNPVLLILFSAIKNLIFGTLVRSLTDDAITEKGLPLHRVVFEAIRDQDAVKATETMRDILLVGEEMYGDDLHVPLSAVLNHRAETNPAYRSLLGTASRIVNASENTPRKGNK